MPSVSCLRCLWSMVNTRGRRNQAILKAKGSRMECDRYSPEPGLQESPEGVQSLFGQPHGHRHAQGCLAQGREG